MNPYDDYNSDHELDTDALQDAQGQVIDFKELIDGNIKLHMDALELKMEALTDKKGEMLRRRLEVRSNAHRDLESLLAELGEGSHLDQQIEEAMLIAEALEERMLNGETDLAVLRFKDSFDQALTEIMEVKAELQFDTLSEYIEAQDSFLDRISENSETPRETLDEAWRIRESLNSPEAIEMANEDLIALTGLEHQDSLQEFQAKKGEVVDEAKSLLASHYGAAISEDAFNAQFDGLLRKAREVGGEKLELQLYRMRAENDVRRSVQGGAEAGYMKEMFSDKLWHKLALLEDENAYNQAISGGSGRSELEIASEMILVMATAFERMTAGQPDDPDNAYSGYLEHFLPDGSFQRFDEMISEFEIMRDSGTLTLASMRDEFEYFDNELLEDDLAFYGDLQVIAEEEIAYYTPEIHDITHQALAYEWAITDATEKEDSIDALNTMFEDFDVAMGEVQELYSISGDANHYSQTQRTDALRDASISLQEVDVFATLMAGEVYADTSDPARHDHEHGERDISELMRGHDTFLMDGIEHEEVLDYLYSEDDYYAGEIDDLLNPVDSSGDELEKPDVTFVTRETFDGFFNGEKDRDDLRGVEGCFYEGRIIIVFDPEVEPLNVKYTHKVLVHELTHEMIHIEHESADRMFEELLYGNFGYNEEGIDAAAAKRTAGGLLISRFMEHKGVEFTDWVRDRTGELGDITFEEIVADPEIAFEILEELVVIYLTKISVDGVESLARANVPQWLKDMQTFHKTTDGQELLSQFMLDDTKRKPRIRGFEDDGAGAGAAGGGDEIESGQADVPDIDGLKDKIDKIAINTIPSIKKKMQSMYGVDDFDGLLKKALGEQQSLLQLVEGLKEEHDGEVPEGIRRQVEEKIKKLEKDLGEIKSALDEEAAKREETPQWNEGYLSRLWRNTTFVAINDVIKVFEDGWSYLKERRELRRDRVSAEVGMTVAPTNRMSSYFEGLEQAVQNRDVAKWKEIYDDKDPKTIDEILRSASDVNQVKALFEIKANTTGDFFFRNKDVMQALERITGEKIGGLNEKGEYVGSYNVAKEAFDRIYGRGEADGLERQNEGTRSGKISEAEKLGEQNSDRLGTLWMEWLHRFEDGDWIDTAKFEGFLHYAFKAGKSWARQAMWIMAKGYVEGILDYTSMIQMTSSLMVHYPPLEYVNDMVKFHDQGIIYHGSMTEMEYIANFNLFTRDGGHDKTPQGVNDWIMYERWILNKLDTEAKTHQRLEKIVRAFGDTIDHDYAQDIWWEFTPGTYENILSDKTGNVTKITDPGIVNLYGQFLVNSLVWSDDRLIEKFRRWRKTDSLLFEEHFETSSDGSFVTTSDGSRKKKPNKTAFSADKLEGGISGAMYAGFPMKYSRNAIYHAYRVYAQTGDIQAARNIMVGAALDLQEMTGMPWIDSARVEMQYESMGWTYDSIPRNIVTSLEDAPLSHTIPFGQPPRSMRDEIGSRYTF